MLDEGVHPRWNVDLDAGSAQSPAAALLGFLRWLVTGSFDGPNATSARLADAPRAGSGRLRFRAHPKG